MHTKHALNIISTRVPRAECALQEPHHYSRDDPLHRVWALDLVRGPRRRTPIAT